MKKIVLISLISLFSLSCLDDLNTVKKESLFVFFSDMKEEILKDNIKWIEKNSNIDDTSSLENIVIKNNDSIKKLLSSSNGEYSCTINYVIGEANNSDSGNYIIRNTAFSPTYYYIRLIYSSSKWKIESIDKLPIN